MAVQVLWPVAARGYVIAIGAMVVAVLLRLLLSAVLGDQGPYFPFVLAVLGSAWYGGLKPGLLATALGALLGASPFFQVGLSSWPGNRSVVVVTAFFVVIGVTASLVCEALHSARRSIEYKQRQLEQADRRKDEFLATLAHELRNPLAPMRIAVELLQSADDQPELRSQARDMMERQLGVMVRLIDDLLDVGRITHGKLQLHMERVELALVARTALETARPHIEAQSQELTVMLPSQSVFLECDPMRLAQVLMNLLTNAAKYTEKGGHIWLTAELQGNEVVVSVRDTGVGIAAGHLPLLFKMFSQVTPALERSQGGLGIGLALVRAIVELHGGSVEASSAGPGLGSEFIVRLPIAAAPVEMFVETSNHNEEGQSSRQRRILVADDNRDATDGMAMMLRMKGHHTRTAYDGLEAVQLAASFRPDLLLLDIGMPKMNGYEVARHIRQQPWGKNMVLIALTGWGQEKDKRRALEAGFDHHQTKPVVPATLEKLLDLFNPVSHP
jgi:signal transduction histidine kinase